MTEATYSIGGSFVIRVWRGFEVLGVVKKIDLDRGSGLTSRRKASFSFSSFSYRSCLKFSTLGPYTQEIYPQPYHMPLE